MALKIGPKIAKTNASKVINGLIPGAHVGGSRVAAVTKSIDQQPPVDLLSKFFTPDGNVRQELKLAKGDFLEKNGNSIDLPPKKNDVKVSTRLDDPKPEPEEPDYDPDPKPDPRCWCAPGDFSFW